MIFYKCLSIFILWFQGFENAPNPVKYCVESWKFYTFQSPIYRLQRRFAVQLPNYIKRCRPEERQRRVRGRHLLRSDYVVNVKRCIIPNGKSIF